MDIHVFYRGALNKLHRIEVTDVEDHITALAMVAEEIKEEAFVQKPLLAMLIGGKK